MPGSITFGRTSEEPLESVDLHHFYSNSHAEAPTGTIDNYLFFVPVSVDNVFAIKGMLDTGSRACTFNDKVEKKRSKCNAFTHTLVGCGGKVTRPKCMYEVELKIMGRAAWCLFSLYPASGMI